MRTFSKTTIESVNISLFKVDPPHSLQVLAQTVQKLFHDRPKLQLQVQRLCRSRRSVISSLQQFKWNLLITVAVYVKVAALNLYSHHAGHAAL